MNRPKTGGLDSKKFTKAVPESVKESSMQDQQIKPGEWGNEYGEELKDLSKIAADRIVEIAQDVGKRLSPRRSGGIDLKINQIRRFLDEARRIESDVKRGQFLPDRVILLRPKLAYSAGREPKVKDLMNVLDPAIKSAAQSKENFFKFLRLIEGIVAYHRYYGGTN